MSLASPLQQLPTRNGHGCVNGVKEEVVAEGTSGDQPQGVDLDGTNVAEDERVSAGCTQEDATPATSAVSSALPNTQVRRVKWSKEEHLVGVRSSEGDKTDGVAVEEVIQGEDKTSVGVTDSSSSSVCSPCSGHDLLPGPSPSSSSSCSTASSLPNKFLSMTTTSPVITGGIPQLTTPPSIPAVPHISSSGGTGKMTQSRGGARSGRGGSGMSGSGMRYIPVHSMYYQQQQQSGPGVGNYSRQGQGFIEGDRLSTTNLYIRGLSKDCTDEDLVQRCKRYGNIISTKAILDKSTGLCRGFGFVDFESPVDAQAAVVALQSEGVYAQFAKLPQQEQDPTNLYFSGLPRDYDEEKLERLVQPYGRIITKRVITNGGVCKGVGFCRMENVEVCKKVIEMLDKANLPGTTEGIMVKFADANHRRKNNRWREYDESCMYDTSGGAALMSPTSVLSSRGLVPHGMITGTPYMAGTGMQSYQLPGAGLPSAAWHTTYYVPPAGPLSGGGGQVDLAAAQMGQLQLSGNSYTRSAQHTPTPYHLPSSQYTGPWTFPHHGVPLSHTQEHSSEHHTHHSPVETKPHPAVQVITGPTPTVGVSDRTSTGQMEESTPRHVPGMHMYINPGNSGSWNPK